MVHSVKDLSELESLLKDANDKLVVIDFYATWCGPCKVIAPYIDTWSTEMPHIVFLKVDVDEAEDVAHEYKITAMPTFVLVKNSQRIDELMGASVDKLKDLITQHS